MKKNMKCLCILAFAACSFVLSAEAFQSSYDLNYLAPDRQPGVRESHYEMQIFNKLERGIKNFFLGWLEIPHGIKSEFYYRRQEYLPAGIETFFIGAFNGTMNAVGRTGVGFYEFFTAPFPQEPILEDMDEWLY